MDIDINMHGSSDSGSDKDSSEYSKVKKRRIFSKETDVPASFAPLSNMGGSSESAMLTKQELMRHLGSHDLGSEQIDEILQLELRPVPADRTNDVKEGLKKIQQPMLVDSTSPKYFWLTHAIEYEKRKENGLTSSLQQEKLSDEWRAELGNHLKERKEFRENLERLQGLLVSNSGSAETAWLPLAITFAKSKIRQYNEYMLESTDLDAHEEHGNLSEIMEETQKILEKLKYFLDNKHAALASMVYYKLSEQLADPDKDDQGISLILKEGPSRLGLFTHPAIAFNPPKVLSDLSSENIASIEGIKRMINMEINKPNIGNIHKKVVEDLKIIEKCDTSNIQIEEAEAWNRIKDGVTDARLILKRRESLSKLTGRPFEINRDLLPPNLQQVYDDVIKINSVLLEKVITIFAVFRTA